MSVALPLGSSLKHSINSGFLSLATFEKVNVCTLPLLTDGNAKPERGLRVSIVVESVDSLLEVGSFVPSDCVLDLYLIQASSYNISKSLTSLSKICFNIGAGIFRLST